MKQLSIWLVLELILVTIVMWWAFDPVVVNTYVGHMPMGYDHSRMVELTMGNSLKVDEEDKWTVHEFDKEYDAITAQLEALPEVECMFEDRGHYAPLFNVNLAGSTYYLDSGDSLVCWNRDFYPGSRVFQAFGIQSLTPSVPQEHLTDSAAYNADIIITRTAAMKMFGTTDVRGRRVMSHRGGRMENGEFVLDDTYYNIRAVVEDFRHTPLGFYPCVVYRCQGLMRDDSSFILRLRQGVSATAFVEKYRRWFEQDLRAGSVYVRSVMTGDESMSNTLERFGIVTQNRRNLLIALFFGVNVAFGVVGTLLMHTRRRSEEAGVMRAFGATRLRVFGMFISEAFVMTTVSVAVGCIIYLQIALSKGFYSNDHEAELWFNDFWTHFAVLSTIIYLIILLLVMAGTAIPAWNICRQDITKTLKDE